MTYSIPELDRHAVIAWDMDGTLIEGPNAHRFCRYIVAHPEQRHFIVTFRTPRAWALDVYRELRPFGIEVPAIEAIHNVPDDLYHAWAQRLTFPQPAKIQAFLEWKGMISAQIGATVLVDDMPDLVLLGCERYGVAYVDSHARFPDP